VKLSPLNLSGLIANARLALAEPELPTRTPVMVEMWSCPKCRELHEAEDDAASCCAPSGGGTDHDTRCPVCSEEAADFRAAADCCLWKDLAAPVRWRIADAVEAGATWTDALGVKPS
jgi:hypothetical protein